MRRIVFVLVALMFPSYLFGQLVTDPLPYAAIANPLPDTMDQLYRDSVNLKFSPIRINQAGYRPQDDKYFYYVASSGTPSGFKVIDIATGATAGTGTLTSTIYTCSGQLKITASNNAQLMGGGDTRYTMDSKQYAGSLYSGLLPTLGPGAYRVVVGSDTSAKFVVDEKLYGWVKC